MALSGLHIAIVRSIDADRRQGLRSRSSEASVELLGCQATECPQSPWPISMASTTTEKEVPPARKPGLGAYLAEEVCRCGEFAWQFCW